MPTTLDTEHPPHTGNPNYGAEEAEAIHRALAVRWDHMPATSSFQRWVQDLQRAAKAPTPSTWRLAGQGVLLVHGDGDEASSFLAMAADAAGMAYVEIAAGRVVDEFQEWHSLFHAEAPTLVHLQSGVWVAEHAELDDEALYPHHPHPDSDAAAAFRHQLAQAMATDLPGHAVVVVVAVPRAEKLADELRRACQFTREVHIPEADGMVHGRALLAMCPGLPWSMGAIEQLDDLGAVLHDLSTDQKLQVLAALRHRAWRDERPLTLRDLIECKLFGMGVPEPELHAPQRWRTAVHEAGHVLMEFLASGGTAVAAYCSVLGHGDAAGIAVPMLNTPQRPNRSDPTYGDQLRLIKVLVAGRAAEQLLLGALEVSASGSTSDLTRASNLAQRLVNQRGLPIDTATDAGMSAHLLIGNTSPHTSGEAEHRARASELLQSAYAEVLARFREHRPLLETLAARLTEKQALLHEELREILLPAPEPLAANA